MKKALSLKDVSQRLGVSTATISNAFNRPDQLSEKLRERILSECKEMGYSGPSLVARSLRSGTTDVIGVMFADTLSYSFLDPMATRFMTGISEQLAGANKQLLLLSSAVTNDSHLRAESLPDGIIFYGEPCEESVKRITSTGKPAVVVDYQHAQLPSLNINNREVCCELVNQIVTDKSIRVVIIGMRLLKSDSVTFLDKSELTFSGQSIAWSRLQGYLDGLNDVGVDLDRVDVIHLPVNTTENAKLAAELFLAENQGATNEQPKLVLCMSDVIALGVMDVAMDKGIEIPNQLQITGFDDIPEAARARVPLTTVCQQGIEKGQLACSMLLSNSKASTPEPIRAKVIVREST